MSVTSAIISIANYDAMFDKKIIGNLIYPNKDETPIYNPSGIYGVKVKFNGAQRLILVDDYLPVDKSGEHVFAKSLKENEFAPQLFEKAILKLY